MLKKQWAIILVPEKAIQSDALEWKLGKSLVKTGVLFSDQSTFLETGLTI